MDPRFRGDDSKLFCHMSGADSGKPVARTNNEVFLSFFFSIFIFYIRLPASCKSPTEIPNNVSRHVHVRYL